CCFRRHPSRVRNGRALERFATRRLVQYSPYYYSALVISLAIFQCPSYCVYPSRTLFFTSHLGAIACVTIQPHHLPPLSDSSHLCITSRNYLSSCAIANWPESTSAAPSPPSSWRLVF